MSKAKSLPAPTLMAGKQLQVEPLAAQAVTQVLYYIRESSQFLKPFSPSWPNDYLEESFWQRKIWASSQDWQNDTGYHFIIRKIKTDRNRDQSFPIIGHINLTQVFRGAFQNAFLGYGLDQNHQGQGLMSEAVGLIKKFAFEKLDLHRIQANTLVENIPSQRVLLNNGFWEEGLAKNYLEIDGKWQDHKMYACLNE